MEKKYIPIHPEDHDRIIKGQTDGLSLEMALYNAGFQRGIGATQLNPDLLKVMQDAEGTKESALQKVKDEIDLEEQANAAYQKYCTDKGLVYHLMDAANFCLGYIAARGPRWVKATLPKKTGEYYCKCKIDGEEKRLIIEFDNKGNWGEAPGYDYYDDLEIIEWLDDGEQ